jgi:hypothetical protein
MPCSALLLALPAQASDRPFLIVTTAAAEDDDDQVWSIEAFALSGGGSTAQNLTLGYSFNPLQSVQIETAHVSSGATVEFEYKHLFNDIARDRWGVGLNLAYGTLKPSGQPWRHGAWSVVLPLSWQLGDDRSTLWHVYRRRSRNRRKPSWPCRDRRRDPHQSERDALCRGGRRRLGKAAARRFALLAQARAPCARPVGVPSPGRLVQRQATIRTAVAVMPGDAGPPRFSESASLEPNARSCPPMLPESQSRSPPRRPSLRWRPSKSWLTESHGWLWLVRVCRNATVKNSA